MVEQFSEGLKVMNENICFFLTRQQVNESGYI